MRLKRKAMTKDERPRNACRHQWNRSPMGGLAEAEIVEVGGKVDKPELIGS